MVVRSCIIAACRASNGTRLKFKQWNKKSCGIFYREIRRKATDKEGQRKKWRKGSRYGSLFYRQRVTLRHKSYSVGRDTLAWPLLQETISQPLRALSRCGFRLRLFTLYQLTTFLVVFIAWTAANFTATRRAISLTPRKTYKISVAKRRLLDGHILWPSVRVFA